MRFERPISPLRNLRFEICQGRSSLAHAADAEFSEARPVFGLGWPLITLEADPGFAVQRQITFASLPPVLGRIAPKLAANAVIANQQSESHRGGIQLNNRNSARAIFFLAPHHDAQLAVHQLL